MEASSAPQLAHGHTVVPDRQQRQHIPTDPDLGPAQAALGTWLAARERDQQVGLNAVASLLGQLFFRGVYSPGAVWTQMVTSRLVDSPSAGAAVSHVIDSGSAGAALVQKATVRLAGIALSS